MTSGFQTEYAHVLYGALEGGPNQDGSFTDSVSAYQNTEVAIDYNAGVLFPCYQHGDGKYFDRLRLL